MERFEVINVLDFLGVSPKYEGYKYIVDDTIMMMDLVKNNKKIVLLDLFLKTANKYNTNFCCIEKNMRACVEGTFKNGNLKHIYEIFNSISSYYDDRPSNKLFLTTIVNYLNKKR